MAFKPRRQVVRDVQANAEGEQMPKAQTSRRVTFIADPRVPGVTLGVADPLELSNVDRTLRRCCKRVEWRDVSNESFGEAASHLLVQVSDVRQIWACLNQLFPDDSKGITPEQRVAIQLVGHAYSGSLWLGPPTNDEGALPVFTCDAKTLGLFGQFAHCVSEVMLAGCQVAAWRPNGYEVNGRTLMFALAELLKCRVRGACTLVQASSFDNKTGWYNDKPIGWALRPRRRNKTTAQEGTPRLGFKAHGEGLPTPSAITVSGGSLSPEEIEIVSEYFNAQLAQPKVPRLARRELELEFQFPDSKPPKDAAIYCSGQFLELRNAGSSVFFAHRGLGATPKGQGSAPNDSRARWSELFGLLCNPGKRSRLTLLVGGS
jgi:hypothetical protein